MWLVNESELNIWSQVGIECDELKSLEMGKCRQSATFLLGRASKPCRCRKHWGACSKTGKLLLAWAVCKGYQNKEQCDPGVVATKNNNCWTPSSTSGIFRFRLVLVCLPLKVAHTPPLCGAGSFQMSLAQNPNQSWRYFTSCWSMNESCLDWEIWKSWSFCCMEYATNPRKRVTVSWNKKWPLVH